jgi:hypothetical protein
MPILNPKSASGRLRVGVLAALAALGSIVVLAVSACAGTGSADVASVTSGAPATGHAKHTIVAVGDIACPANRKPTADECAQTSVAKRVTAISPAAVLLLGDVQYDFGRLHDFRTSFGKSWGGLRKYWHPVPGNHEYFTPHASGYFDFFGKQAGNPSGGYYSYDVSGWHVVALNSNCDVLSCSPDSPQGVWLKNDLAQNQSKCVAAYWHHPLYSSGEHGNNAFVKPFWQALLAAHADLVLNGHDHDYERFAPQNADGAADPANGIREFVVGTGGRSHYGIAARKPNSEFAQSGAFGALALKLSKGGYKWNFTDVAGKSLDHGSAGCN